MHKLLIISVLLHPFFLTAQNNATGKAELSNLIKKVIAQKDKEIGSGGEWFARNDDSCFYKNDTVRFCNSSNYMSVADHDCSYKTWEFAKGSLFYERGQEICHEPPLTTMEMPWLFIDQLKSKTVYYPPQYLLREVDNAILLVLYNYRTVFAEYKLVAINPYPTKADWGEDIFELVLVRQHVFK